MIFPSTCIISHSVIIHGVSQCLTFVTASLPFSNLSHKVCVDKILGLARAGRVALKTYDSRRPTTEEGKKEGKKRGEEEEEKTKKEEKEKEVEKEGEETEGREVDRAEKDRAEKDEKKDKTNAEAGGGMEEKEEKQTEEEEEEDALPTVYSIVAKAGDVVIMHPWNVHCGTTNLRSTPRFMANGMVRMTREAFEAR